MKQMIPVLLATALSSWLPSAVLAAAPFSYSGEAANVSAVGGTTDIGTSGYLFFEDYSASTGYEDVSSLPAYAQYTPDPTSSPYPVNTQLNIDGTTYTTGINYTQYNGSAGASGSDVFGEITLNDGTPNSFVLGLLSNTRVSDTPTYELTLDHDGEMTNFEFDTSDPGVAQNDFYFVTVSGAVAGDTITISGPGDSRDGTLGGITFDASLPSEVPEPSSLALVGAGGVLLLGLLRLTRKNQTI